MPSNFSDQAIVKLKGQVQYSAVDPDQRWLVSYMRQHPDATLAEARASRKPRYTKDELSDMAAHKPWEDLTTAQRKLMRGIPDEPVTVAMIAYHSGIPESVITKQLDRLTAAAVDRSSLVFKASRGFFGKTIKGRKTVVFYVVRSHTDPDDFWIMFSTAKALEKIIHEHMPCPSPPCEDEDDTEVVIPLKDGSERSSLPESAKEISGEE